jgi:hypothetical protein
MNSVIATGPTQNTQNNAIAQAGPITDYVGMLQSVLLNLEEAKTKLNGINGAGGLVALTDAADPNLATLQNILLSLS